jgi:hypothetical protein
MNENQPYNPYGASAHEYAGPPPALTIGLPIGLKRGLVTQVPILGVLMVIQGVLELIMSAGIFFYAFFMPMIFDEMRRDAARNNQPAPPLPAEMESLLAIGGTALGVIIAVVAIVTILAGARLIVYRSRVLGVTSACLGLLMLPTCYCFPTALGIAIYGMIVLLNPSVQLAFELRKTGHSVRDIQRAFMALD